MTSDPELWKHDDHRERAEKLIAEGKPLSVHFDGKMYVHGSFVHVPLWIGDVLVWETSPTCGTPGFGSVRIEIADWRRRVALQ